MSLAKQPSRIAPDLKETRRARETLLGSTESVEAYLSFIFAGLSERLNCGKRNNQEETMEKCYFNAVLMMLSFGILSATGIAQVSSERRSPASKFMRPVNGTADGIGKRVPNFVGGGGDALSFDGSSGYVEGNLFEAATANLTLECWVNWSGSTSVNFPTIIYNGNSSTNGYGLYLDHVDHSDELCFLAGGVDVVETGVWLTEGEWTHIALTCDNTLDWKVYVGSTMIDCGIVGPTTPTDGFYVGGMLNANNFYGTIDEVRFWNTCRTADQISDYMDVSLTNCAGSNLICYWKFNDGSGSTATDSSGNGNEGKCRIPYGSGYEDWTTGWVASDAPITSDVSLSVQATDFAVKADVNSVRITWSTESEVNNAGFNVLRQESSSASFNLIGSCSSDDALKGMGTSSTGQSYNFVDTKVKSGETYNYKIQSVSTDGATADLVTLRITVSLPGDYALYQNYPNPFNPSTVISYKLAALSDVTLKVYDVLGRAFKTLVHERQDAGEHSVTFNAANLPSGVYFYRLQAGTFAETKKLIVLR